ncbi:MAG: restriction endonuclease [Promethearchaeota archaeon]
MKELFKALSEVKRLYLNNKNQFKTSIFYQIGEINNKLAIRFYKNRKPIKTLIAEDMQTNFDLKDFMNEDIWRLIEKLGGQTLSKAHFQREESLTAIIKSYFEKKGFVIEEQPKLGEYQPDLLVYKKEDKAKRAYIEIKAYFGKTYVGEPEIAQLLKYYQVYHLNNGNNKENLQENVSNEENSKNKEKNINPKFLLITTGKLIKNKENLLFDMNFRNLKKEKQIERVKSKYKKYMDELNFVRSLEMRDTKSMYKFAFDRFKKNYIDEIWSIPKMHRLTKPISLDKIIDPPPNAWYSKFDVFLIPAYTFAEILKREKLEKEEKIFQKIRKTWIERMIFDKNLIKFP